MRAAAIAGVSRRRSEPVKMRQARDHHPASGLVRRNFMAERPNALWVAAITFLPTSAGFLYLAVLDAWSRRIVGWAFSSDLKTRVVESGELACMRPSKGLSGIWPPCGRTGSR
jgi:putative transposase